MAVVQFDEAERKRYEWYWLLEIIENEINNRERDNGRTA